MTDRGRAVDPRRPRQVHPTLYRPVISGEAHFLDVADGPAIQPQPLRRTRKDRTGSPHLHPPDFDRRIPWQRARKRKGHNGNEVAIGIVLDGHTVLMGEKCDPADPLAGTLILPGGHIDEGEDPMAAASREVEEETGLPTEPVRVVGTMTKGGNELTFVLLRATGGPPNDTYELKHVAFYDVSDTMGRTLATNLKMIAAARAVETRAMAKGDRVGLLRKYSPDEARIDSGPGGGRWTREGAAFERGAREFERVARLQTDYASGRMQDRLMERSGDIQSDAAQLAAEHRARGAERDALPDGPPDHGRFSSAPAETPGFNEVAYRTEDGREVGIGSTWRDGARVMAEERYNGESKGFGDERAAHEWMFSAFREASRRAHG